MCVSYLLTLQFKKYVEDVAKSDCRAELRRLLTKGPPVNLKEEVGLPTPDGSGEVYRLWFSSDKEEHSAKLEGSLEGEERKAWWDAQIAEAERKYGPLNGEDAPAAGEAAAAGAEAEAAAPSDA
jgi:hypothetical protein